MKKAINYFVVFLLCFSFFGIGFFVSHDALEHEKRERVRLEKNKILLERSNAIRYVDVLSELRKGNISLSIKILEVQLKGILEKETFYMRDDFLKETSFFDNYSDLVRKIGDYQNAYCNNLCIIDEKIEKGIDRLHVLNKEGQKDQ